MSKPSGETFVPLTLASAPKAKREDFRVLVAQRPELARPLSQLSPAPAGHASQPHSPRCEPKVTLQREADRVTAIHIECSCGQTIELNCVY